jgi:hypothetical protein
MGRYEGGRNGGKLPERFRNAFQDAVEAFVIWQFVQTPEPTVWFDDEHGEITLSRVCGLMWNCTDYLPLKVMARISWLTDDGKLVGSSYACGARRLRGLIEWRRSLDQPPLRYEPRGQHEAAPLAQAEEPIGGAVPPPILSFSDIDKLIADVIGEAFDETRKPAAPVLEIDPEINKACEALTRLFGTDADDESAKTAPTEQPK